MEAAKPTSGFGINVPFLSLSYRLADDPSEMFTLIFGGEAFMDWFVLFHYLAKYAFAGLESFLFSRT
jgi:hypothetical protein